MQLCLKFLTHENDKKLLIRNQLFYFLGRSRHGTRFLGLYITILRRYNFAKKYIQKKEQKLSLGN